MPEAEGMPIIGEKLTPAEFSKIQKPLRYLLRNVPALLSQHF